MCTATEGKSADCAGKLGKVLLAAERSTENASGLALSGRCVEHEHT